MPIFPSMVPPATSILCCLNLLLLLRSQYLCLGLKPILQGESVNLSALLVQLVGALADALCNIV